MAELSEGEAVSRFLTAHHSKKYQLRKRALKEESLKDVIKTQCQKQPEIEGEKSFYEKGVSFPESTRGTFNTDEPRLGPEV